MGGRQSYEKVIDEDVGSGGEEYEDEVVEQEGKRWSLCQGRARGGASLKTLTHTHESNTLKTLRFFLCVHGMFMRPLAYPLFPCITKMIAALLLGCSYSPLNQD
jgi:hypothetical protein